MLNLKRGQLPIFITNIAALCIFSFVFFSRRNSEFIFYIAVILFFLLLILFTNKRVGYSNTVLWGLTVWAVMHMSGGGVEIGGRRLYEAILVPLVGEPYNIFRYDQLVHIVGFGVATLLMYYLLRPSLGKPRKASLLIVVLMAGLGVGAVNEIIEFFATMLVPETGVGGYYNTSLDLVADLVGGLIALALISAKEGSFLRSARRNAEAVRGPQG